MGRRLITGRRPVYLPWRRDSNDFSWDAHVVNVKGEGKLLVGKMNAMLTDSHLDIRVQICILIVPKLKKCRKKVGTQREFGKTVGSDVDGRSLKGAGRLKHDEQYIKNRTENVPT